MCNVGNASNFSSGSVGAVGKPDCPYNMTVQNVYNISNHGTMYFPGAAQGTQCGDCNSMYMSLAPNRNDASDYENCMGDSAGYEHLATDPEMSHF